MSEPAGGRVLVLSRTWWLARSESAFVLRTLSGALSRHVTVDVLTPGPQSSTIADGLFDVRTLGGVGTAATWPRPFDVSPEEVCGSIAERPVAALMEAGDGSALELLARHEPDVPTILVGVDPDEAAAALSASTGGKAPRSVGLSPLDVGLHVPVNPLAAQRPHNGFGFTDYLLVLTDRSQWTSTSTAATDSEVGPTPLAAWLIARFPGKYVVVVENAMASAWHHRSLRGSIRVDTRTDLWRLMAHARTTIDLAPGKPLARECVESLRFGTPIVVPKGTVGALHAEAGGGLWFGDEAELLGCVDALLDPELRAALGRQGRAHTNATYGDPDRFTARVGRELSASCEPLV